MNFYITSDDDASEFYCTKFELYHFPFLLVCFVVLLYVFC